jgi:hypothetical protein
MSIIRIYRAAELYNRRYEVIEPQLERVALGERAAGYTNRSVRRVIEAGIAKAATYRRHAEVEAVV